MQSLFDLKYPYIQFRHIPVSEQPRHLIEQHLDKFPEIYKLYRLILQLLQLFEDD